MEFKKGDTQIHYFSVPTSSWTSGGTLFFAAKEIVDNDATDAKAVINKSFNDTKIVGSTHAQYEAGYQTYELEFLPNDIINVNFLDGEKKKRYLGEFQFVPTTGNPESYPSTDQFIDVIIYADIKRGTT